MFRYADRVGAVFLVWIGPRLWRVAPVAPDTYGELSLARGARGFASDIAVVFLNPRIVVFFLALVVRPGGTMKSVVALTAGAIDTGW